MPSQNCPKCPPDTSVQACPYCGAGAAELWNRAAVTVKSLKEFVTVIAPMAPDSRAKTRGHYWYRGQTNAGWGLETSFLRMTQHLAKQPEEAINLQDVERQEFMSKTHLFIDTGNMEKVKTMPAGGR
jgi:hypothetical protein